MKKACFVLFLIFLPTFMIQVHPLWSENEERSPVYAGKGISIGIEYCMLDNAMIINGHSKAFGELGISGAKHYAEHVDWDSMQKGPRAQIDFSKLDGFVREYQKNGFTELTVCLKPNSRWASVDVGTLLKKNLGGTNASPKPQFMPNFENWIRQVVERYDADGKADMPGLRFPVRHIEIGSEFSTYEPEPAAVYLNTLEHAYKAAHSASDRILVAHAAFLPTPADFSKVKNPDEYEKVFNQTPRHDKTHGIEDMRRVLDRPEIFDVVNIHPLGDPYEIESIVAWLNYEMEKRNYHKDIIISDTINTSYVAWGPAAKCQGKKLPDGRVQGLGILIPPATEADRCRIADYFGKLLKGDKAVLAWTRAFVAADHVQRTVIAAEQGIKLINLSFTSDLPFLTSPLMQAGAGISAWGGMIKSNFMGAVQEKYPNFYAIQQMGRYIQGYDFVERVNMPDERARVYLFTKQGKRFWVAWMNPKGVYLPENSKEQVQVSLQSGSDVVLEEVVTESNMSSKKSTSKSQNGTVNLTLSFTPVYIFPS